MSRLEFITTSHYCEHTPPGMLLVKQVMSNPRIRSRGEKKAVLRMLTGCLAANDSDGKELSKDSLVLWGDVCTSFMRHMQKRWTTTARKMQAARRVAMRSRLLV